MFLFISKKIPRLDLIDLVISPLRARSQPKTDGECAAADRVVMERTRTIFYVLRCAWRERCSLSALGEAGGDFGKRTEVVGTLRGGRR